MLSALDKIDDKSPLVCLHPVAKVKLGGGSAIWLRSDRRVTSRVNSEELEKSIKAIAKGPVLRSDLPETFPLDQLVKLGMIVYADNRILLHTLLEHLYSSMPANPSIDSSEIKLRKMRQRAERLRFRHSDCFSEAKESATEMEIPLAMQRAPSAPLDIGPQTESPLGEDDISRLLRTWHNTDNRLYPSAGALYPIRVVIECCDLETNKLYTYDPTKDRVEVVLKKPSVGVVYDETFAKSKLRVWFCGHLEEVTQKYGLRGYRYMLLEAGHAAQAFIQLLNWMGLRIRPYGGYDDELAAAYLDLERHTVVAHALGVYGGLSSETNWIVASETRYSVISGDAVHYAESFGGVDENNYKLHGFGVDHSPHRAQLKSQAELAERITLAKSRKKLKNSNGMAAHTKWDQAARNATLELYERHCVLRTWLLRLKTEKLVSPESSTGKTAKELAAMGGVELVLIDVSDPYFEIPCVAAVIHTPEHGGVILASAAAESEERAAHQTLLEIIKSLYYRLIIRNGAVFEDEFSGTLSSPEDHERWYANRQVAKNMTSFLTQASDFRELDRTAYPLARLFESVRVEDFTFAGPDPTRWKVCRASSPRLLKLHFGTPPDGYYSEVKKLLDEKNLNREPHPIG